MNCDNALTPASGGSKFKGTIMMGTAGGPAASKPEPQSPQQPAPPEASSGSEAQPDTQAQGAAKQGLAFQKTMMGPMVAPQPGAGAEQPGAAPPTEQPTAGMAHAATVEQDAPPATASPSTPTKASAQGFSQPSAGHEDEPPRLPQSSATKTMVMVLGASVVIAALIVGAALFLR